MKRTSSHPLVLVVVCAVLVASCGRSPADPLGPSANEVVLPTPAPADVVDSSDRIDRSLPASERTGATAETVPTPTSTPASEPLPGLDSIVVIGDSMSAGLAAPLRAALENEGRTVEWRWWVGFLTPAPARVWNELFDEMRPDVVVLFFAPWESEVLRSGGRLDPNDAGWQQVYLDQHVLPFVERVRESGSHLVWVGMPETRDDVPPASHADLNAVWHTAVDRSADVSWIDGPELVGGPGGGYLEFDDNSSPPTRLINTDGLHLCPPATEKIADEVLSRLGHEFEFEPNDEWRSTDWAAYPGAFGPEGCATQPPTS